MIYSYNNIFRLLFLVTVTVLFQSALVGTANGSIAQESQPGEGGSVITYVIIKGSTLAIQKSSGENVEDKIKEITKKYPPNSTLTKQGIKDIANFFGLTDNNQFNFKMALQEGDFSYFAEQKWPAWRLIVEFAAKKMVLDAANAAKVSIPTKGDWSAAAEQVMDTLPIDKIKQGKL